MGSSTQPGLLFLASVVCLGILSKDMVITALLLYLCLSSVSYSDTSLFLPLSLSKLIVKSLCIKQQNK